MYSTLWTKKAGHLEPYAGDMVGDLAESWEVSGDQLTVTVKITPKAHFAGPEGSPVNGREVNARDVEYTWNRYKAEGAIRTEVVNDENPEAPIVSMTATDDRTLVIQLAKPDATLFGLLAQQRAGNFYALPIEADNIDYKNVSIGSGPWVIDRWEPGVGHYLKKNPGYHQDYRGEDLPYLDRLDMPELQEQALNLAQFRAGNVQLWGSYIQQDQVLPLKRDIPELQMYLQDPITTSMRLIMGKAEGSPFIDERVRQAAMFVMDRQLMIETLGNTAEFEAEGLPVTKTYDTSMAVNQPGFWFLDPSSPEFGPNAKYFEYNPEEAQALLSAAGHPDGLDTTMIATFGYNPGILAKMDVVLAVFGGGQGGPIRYTIRELDYHTEWSPVVRFGKGLHNGVAMLQDVDTPDPALYMYIRYNPNGGVFQGGDDTMTELTNKAKAEFDNDARRELVFEMQRHEAKAMNFPFSHGGASQFHLYWPAVRGFDVWRGSNDGLDEVTLWRDPTKEPKA
jgi:peptide/nickel transport system substrate-binding protein